MVPGVDFCGVGELLPCSAGEFSSAPVFAVVFVGVGDGPPRRVEMRRGTMTKVALVCDTLSVTGGRR